MGPLPAIYIDKAKTRLLGVTVDKNLNWIPILQEIVNSFANKLSLLKKSRFLPSHVCESFYLKVIQPSNTYAMPEWKDNPKDNTSVLPGSYDMPTADVLATVKWDTLTHRYKLSLIKLFLQRLLCYASTRFS